MMCDGQRILITGASRGIGAKIAMRCGREGARVAVNYRSHQQHALARLPISPICIGATRRKLYWGGV
jgi:NAD(P)-dependent dehydrogenase (short-subunit alcohol dehydrogenase family)